MTEVRRARENELERVNELRMQVNAIHVAGKPEVFKPGFLRNSGIISMQFRIKIPEQFIGRWLKDGTICRFAVLHHINKLENPFMERDGIFPGYR